ncbi:type II toxin-antitoxin system PemK/MazF family toxin [Microgenomates group bacterium]|nr:type II toxin-antitoxin system PemK/MazF family toxin [Microgenomates group bacterium]
MNDFVKDFDGWIIKKKEHHYRKTIPPLFKERDIWWISIGVNVGFEEDGKNSNFVRPVLIVKKFNRELFLGIPMSTKIKKDNKYYIQVSLKGKNVSVMSSQMRVFSSKRIWNKLAELDEKDFTKVLKEVTKFFVLPSPLYRRGRG